MGEIDLKKVLSTNVRSLLNAEEPLPAAERGHSRLARRANLALGTAQRIIDGNTSIGLDLLHVVATAFRLQPWQLLVPDLDPLALPSLGHAWPFARVQPQRYAALLEREQGMVEAAALFELERIERERERRAPAKPVSPALVQPSASDSERIRLELEAVERKRGPDQGKQAAGRRGAKTNAPSSGKPIPKPQKGP